MPIFDADQLAKWTKGHWKFAAPQTIDGVSTDTRTLVPGNLFVAVKGPRHDGHDFVKHAFEKGASGAVVCNSVGDRISEKSFGSGSAPLLCVEHTADALRDMAARYRKETGVKVIAVTGSVGKTTVKEMVSDVLSIRMRTARTRGNWNNDIGLPLSILSIEPGTRIGVFEIGMNHPGELMPLCRLLAPDWGLVTTIAPVHLEFFRSVAAVAVEKSQLLKILPGDGVAVLRKDDAWYDVLRSAAPCKVVSLALRSDADYWCASECDREGRARIVENATGESFRFKPPLPGRHILINAMYAVAVARGHGLDWADIRLALERYKPQPMRWECQSVGRVTVVNDAYNANPVSMETALQTFANCSRNERKWLVLGGMLELGEAESQAHIDLGIFVAGRSWAGLITIAPLGTIIADSAEKAGMKPDRIFRCADHSEAARTLIRKTSAGDSVLLKASRGEHLEHVLELWLQQQEGKA